MKGTIVRRDGKRGTSWLLKYDGPRDAQGRRQQRYATVRGTKKQAEAELRRLLTAVDQGTHVDPQRLTLAGWCDTWLRDHAAPAVSPKTLERYREILTGNVAPRLGSRLVQKLAPTDLQGLYAELLASGKRPRRKPRAGEEQPAIEGLSPRSVHHVHVVLRQALDAAVRMRIIARNPTDDVRPPKPAASEGADEQGEGRQDQQRALDRAELDCLLRGTAGHGLFPVVAVAAATGLRRGELMALRWADVDLDHGRLRVERSVEFTKAGGCRIKRPKTKGSRRTIAIDPTLCGILRAHRRGQAETALALGARLDASWLLFPASIAEPLIPRNPNYLTKEFAKLAAALGFTGLRLHDLRHTHATLLLTAGAPLNAVSARLGHASPLVTLGTYAHVLKRAEEQAAAAAATLLDAVRSAE